LAMKLPKHRLPDLRYPRTGNQDWTVRTTMERATKVAMLAEQLGVRRIVPGKSMASVGALLESIAAGKVAVVRLDDPQRQLVWAGMGAPAAEDPRCPKDWES
jgi:hypothetical protein